MKTFPLFLYSAALAACLSTASAHLNVGTTRDLGTLSYSSNSINTQTVSSSFGWADGTDSNWGDSHRLRIFKFTLAANNDSATITVARRNADGQTGAIDTLLPAFSLYKLYPGNATFVTDGHDQSAGSVNYLTTTLSFGTNATAESFIDSNSNTYWDTGESFTDANGNGVWDGAGVGGSGKEGVFRALNDFRIYTTTGNSTAFNDFTYLGHAADGTSANYGSASGISGDGNADGTVSATFNGLASGDYYLLVGGADYLAQNTDQLTSGASPTYKTYGVGVTVSAVPEPGTYALLALGAGGLALWRRFRNRQG